MKILQIAREYAGLAEAGGVKNVVCSLSEGLIKLGHQVSLFIPLYGCTNFDILTNYEIIKDFQTKIFVDSKEYAVSFAKGFINELEVIFVVSPCFKDKLGVYTYTKEEELKNPSYTRGKGHIDGVENEIMFQKSIVEYLLHFSCDFDVIHCHDATTAFIPVFANTEQNKSFFSNTKFIVTIHNAGPAYRHEIDGIENAQKLTNIPIEILRQGLVENIIEPYLLASFYASLTTVSPWYAKEILEPENHSTQGLSKAFSENKVSIYGITNGIDFERYNPTDTTKSSLPFAYNPETLDLEGKYRCKKGFFEYFNPLSINENQKLQDLMKESIEQFGYLDFYDEKTVTFAYHGRLVHQKGLEVLAKAIPLCIEQNQNIRFIITGQGDIKLEEQQIQLAKNYPGKILYLRGYNKTLARLCVAVSDYIVLPSFFEPCGLEDFISSILGTIPLAHRTGGLQKIIDKKTGFLYSHNNKEELCNNILNLIDFKINHNSQFLRMIKSAAEKVHYSYDWLNVIKNYYISIYKK